MAERARAPTRGTDTGDRAVCTPRSHARRKWAEGEPGARRPGPAHPRGASPPHWPARAAVPPARSGGARPGRSGARPEAGERAAAGLARLQCNTAACGAARRLCASPGASAPSGERPKRQPRVANDPWLPSQNGLAADQNAPGFGRRSLATSAYCFTNSPPTIGCHGRWGGIVFFALPHSRGGRWEGAFPDTGPCCKPLGMNMGGPVERHVALLGPFPDAA